MTEKSKKKNKKVNQVNINSEGTKTSVFSSEMWGKVCLRAQAFSLHPFQFLYPKDL